VFCHDNGLAVSSALNTALLPKPVNADLPSATTGPDVYRAVLLERCPGVTIAQHVQPDGTVWATRGRRIVRRMSVGKPWQTVAEFPFVSPRDWFSITRPTARAARADRANVYVNAQGKLLAIRAHTAYRLNGGRLDPLRQIKGDCVLHRGICEDAAGWAYFGEYFLNPERGPVRIFRLAPDGGSVEIAHEFPAGQIRHVHGVYRDPFDEAALWITAGDYVDECYIFRTDDRFATLERFGDGTQHWRAVGLFFTSEHICWVTDSHLEQNFACRMSRAEAALELGQQIANSCWYGTTCDDGLHVCFTTVEQGPAIHSRNASVMVSDDAFHWSEATSYRKDAWWPLKVFKYGVISCPSGTMASDNLYISGEGLRKLDGATDRLAIRRVDRAPARWQASREGRPPA